MRHLLLLGLLVPATLMAQGGAPGQPHGEPHGERRGPELFGETVDVLVVNIETVVTDREGDRVTGLTREDFRLLVDGDEVPIGYFTEIRDGRPTVDLIEGDLPEAEPGASPDTAKGETVTGEPMTGEPMTGEPMATNYLVFVDDYFAIGAHRNLVLRGLAEQLSHLGERDRVAVVAYDGSRVVMLVDWTGDPGEIRDGLEAARKRPAEGAKRIAEARMLRPRPRSSTGIDGPIGARFDPGSIGSRFNRSGGYFPLLARQIRRLVDAAAASLRGSLPPPGRKVALLVAGGWASGPLLEMGPDLPRPSVMEGEILERQEEMLDAALWYRPLVDTANLLGYTLYPIDAPGAGWGGPGVGTTDVGTAGVGTAGARNGFGSGERNIEYTLKQLAQETGGRPMLNGMRTTALETVVEDTRSYYWLGFDAARNGTGRYHDVRVEMVREDLGARSRRSFVDLSRQVETRMTVEAGLMLGEGEDMGDLEVTIVEVRKGEARRTVEAHLEVRIPFDDLDLLPMDGRLVAILEVSIGARDKRDVVSDIYTYPVRLELVEPPPPQAHTRFPIRTVVRKERHDLVIAVRDAVGGNVFMRRLPFDPEAERKSPARAADL